MSNPVGEHIAPGQTFLTSSADGRHWDIPKVAFPIYKLQPPDPPGTAMMHQRMGFFIAPDGRLLALAFYGHAPDPFGPGGIGRVVREVHKDGSLGPIYFLRYNARSGWGESNTGFPYYKRAKDAGFIQACDALLGNRLMREQFWEEEELYEGDFFSVKSKGSQEAFNWYHRKDGKLVGLWKWSMAALSSDEGKTWSRPVKVPTLQMTGAKISGRKTSDGRYALLYDPNVDDDHRWPLAIVTGDDGVIFDNMLCIQGEVPPRRFAGRYKDFGSAIQPRRGGRQRPHARPGPVGHLQHEQRGHLGEPRSRPCARPRHPAGSRHIRRPRCGRSRDRLEHLQPEMVPRRCRRLSQREEQEPRADGQGSVRLRSRGSQRKRRSMRNFLASPRSKEECSWPEPAGSRSHLIRWRALHWESSAHSLWRDLSVIAQDHPSACVTVLGGVTSTG